MQLYDYSVKDILYRLRSYFSIYLLIVCVCVRAPSASSSLLFPSLLFYPLLFSPLLFSLSRSLHLLPHLLSPPSPIISVFPSLLISSPLLSFFLLSSTLTSPPLLSHPLSLLFPIVYCPVLYLSCCLFCDLQ